MKVSLVVEDDAGRKFHGEVKLKSQRGTAKPAHSSKAVAHNPATAIKATGAVRILWEKGAFKAAQNLSAIEKELGDLDYNFPKNTLTMALGSAKYLTRRGARGNYRWIQKYKAGA